MLLRSSFTIHPSAGSRASKKAEVSLGTEKKKVDSLLVLLVPVRQGWVCRKRKRKVPNDAISVARRGTELLELSIVVPTWLFSRPAGTYSD